MAEKKSPAFQFYPADFMSDLNVIVMTGQEVGAYALLMSACWLENGVPDDMEELAILSKMTPEQFQISWEKRLKRCFIKREDGKWDHPRLQAERIKQQEFSRKMSDAANRRHSDPEPKQRVGSKKAGSRQSVGNALQSISSNNTPIVPDDVRRVLEHYHKLHPKRKVVGRKVERLVERALKDFTPEELISALSGNAADPWCVQHGKHELGYVLRDSDIISGFLAKAARPALVAVAGGSPRAPDTRDGAW